MGALGEDDLAGVRQALEESGRDSLGAHVVAAADDECRHVDLPEPIADVPAAQRAGDGPLVRTDHGPVRLRAEAGAHALELRPIEGPAAHVAIVEGVECLTIGGIVVCLGLLAAVVLTTVVTGGFLLLRIDSPWWQRNPYVLADSTWGIVYVLHGLAALMLVTMVMVHVYFALRPEKLKFTRAMILGWITRREFDEHHDKERWQVDR